MPQSTSTLHLPGGLLFALCCLLCAALTPPPTASAARAPARPVYDCDGNACSVIALAWEEEGQRFRADNSSDGRVRVVVETFAGESAVTVEPQKSEYLRVKTFNGPYRAAFE